MRMSCLSTNTSRETKNVLKQTKANPAHSSKICTQANPYFIVPQVDSLPSCAPNMRHPCEANCFRAQNSKEYEAFKTPPLNREMIKECISINNGLLMSILPLQARERLTSYQAKMENFDQLPALTYHNDNGFLTSLEPVVHNPCYHSPECLFHSLTNASTLSQSMLSTKQHVSQAIDSKVSCQLRKSDGNTTNSIHAPCTKSHKNASAA